MTVAGTYQFQYSVAGCLDTVAVTVEPCTGCVKPNAGLDITLTCPPTGIVPTTATLAPVTTGGTWAAQTGNPATAAVTGNNVTGLTASGTYKFIYYVDLLDMRQGDAIAEQQDVRHKYQVLFEN